VSQHLKVAELIDLAKDLSPEDRRLLRDALSADVLPRARRIIELRGLGKEIWRGQDAQEFVDMERDSWQS
jgi:hypothetical protein